MGEPNYFMHIEGLPLEQLELLYDFDWRIRLKTAAGTGGAFLGPTKVFQVLWNGVSKMYVIRPTLETEHMPYAHSSQIIGIRENRIFYYSNMHYNTVRGELERIKSSLDNFTYRYPHFDENGGKIGYYNCIETYFRQKNTVRLARQQDIIMQELAILKKKCWEFRMLRGFG